MEKPINPEDFDKAKLSADELASSIREIVFEGRDLTDEVKKLTKEIYKSGEAAAQINKSFRDMSRLERDVSIGMVSILDGSRKILDVEKDKVKSIKLSKLLTADLQGLHDGGIRRAADLEAIHKRKENLAHKFQRDISKTLDIEREELKTEIEKRNQKLKTNDLTKQQHDKLTSEKKVFQDLEKENINKKLKLEDKMLSNLSDQDKEALDKIGKEKDLIKLIEQRLKTNKDVEDALDSQMKLLEKGETKLKKTLSNTAGILGKLGLADLAKPFEKAAEAARVAAIQNKTYKEQIQAAKDAAKELVAEMILLATITAGLKFDEQLTNVARNFGLSHTEARALRYQMSEIAADSENVAINSADIEKSIANLAQQFGTVGNNLRKDVVEEMAVLGKLTKMSAESQGNFARFANISGKSARVITLETRRAVVNAEAERGLRVDINKTLDEAGKINGQIAAQLGGNVTKIASAITVAKQFGMTLQGIAQSGAALLDFQSSISNELEAELLIGKEINLERARLAALTGDYETLTKEINANIGDFGDFTKMNVLQQQALAKSVGMTADGLSDVLLKNENIEELAQQARDAGDEDLAKQLERRSNQEKFTDSMDKLKGIFTDLVGGPMGEMLNVIGAIAQGVASIFNGIYQIFTLGGLVSDQFVGWLLTLGLLYKTFNMIKATKIATHAMAVKTFIVQRSTTASAIAETATRVRKRGVQILNNGLAMVGLRRQQATTAAAGVEMAAKMGAKSFGIGALVAVGILGAIAGAMTSMMSVGDASDDGKGGFQFSPSVGGMFEADPADQVAIGPNVVDNLNNPPTVVAANNQSTPSVDMSVLQEGIAEQNQLLAGILAKPSGATIFDQGSEMLSIRNITRVNQGIIGAEGWSSV